MTILASTQDRWIVLVRPDDSDVLEIWARNVSGNTTERLKRSIEDVSYVLLSVHKQKDRDLAYSDFDTLKIAFELGRVMVSLNHGTNSS